MSNVVVMMTATGWLGDKSQHTCIPCDCAKTAQYWADKYKEAGWDQTWVGGWTHVVTMFDVAVPVL
jgi:hypothetical protein